MIRMVDKSVKARSALPKGWLETQLTIIAQLIFGQSPPSATYNTERNGLPFFQGKAEFGNLYPTIRKWCSTPNKIAGQGDILISVRAPVGPTNIAPSKCAIGRGLAAIRGKAGIDQRYLLHYLRLIEERLEAMGKGTTFKAITSPILKGLKIPLAPSAEQTRIAGKIDKVFDQLDGGENNLKHALALVKQYRQSVLKSAVTGELTREWREQNKDNLESGKQLLERILKSHHKGRKQARPPGSRGKYWGEESKNVDKDGDDKTYHPAILATDSWSEIPHNWCNVRVDVAGEVRLGRQRSPKHHRGAHMHPYLRVANVFEDRIDLSDVNEMNFTPKEFDLYELKRNDILLNEGQSRDLVGRPAIYRGELIGACFTNTLIRFRAYNAVLPEYALMVFRHYLWSGRFRRIAKITTNIAHLGLGRFAELAFPIPPISEQEVIVDEAKRQLVAAEHCAQEISRLVRIAAATRRTILKAAFSGQLVQQDPNDEPATKLLEHIKRKNGGISKCDENQKKRKKISGRKFQKRSKTKKST